MEKSKEEKSKEYQDAENLYGDGHIGSIGDPNIETYEEVKRRSAQYNLSTVIKKKSDEKKKSEDLPND